MCLSCCTTDRLFAGLLNRKCEYKHAKGHKRSTVVHVEEVFGVAWVVITKNPRNHVQCLAKQTGLSQYGMENLLSWLVSIENGAESATVGIWSSEMLRC